MILQLPNRDKPNIKKPNTYVGSIYNRLSSEEKKDLERIFGDAELNAAFITYVIPPNIKTVDEAINYLRKRFDL